MYTLEKVLGKLLRCIDTRYPIELDEAMGARLDVSSNYLAFIYLNLIYFTEGQKRDF